MGSLWGIVFMIVGLVVSVALHELGHLVPAKTFGALVPQYAIGFGPTLARFTVRGTSVEFKAIPLGGFVRILGMYAPGPEDRKRVNRRGQLTLAEEAREASAEEVPEGQEDRAFWRLPARKKVVVMFGGPAMNFLLAFVLLGVAIMGIGAPVATMSLADASARVASEFGAVDGPAATAGLAPGDTITTVGGQAIGSWIDFQKIVASSEGRDLAIGYTRAGAPGTATVTPVRNEAGAWVIGVAADVVYQQGTLGDTVSAYSQVFVGTAAAIVRLPMAVWDVGVSIATGAERDASGVMSIVGVGRLAGEVTGQSDALGLTGIRQTIAVLLSLLASLNMALAVFNLIPLPPLDGGHIAAAAYEGGRALVKRAAGSENPGAVDSARLVPLTWAVGAALAVMSVFLIVADIIKPLTLS